jgi:hypothetical protein
MSNYQILLFNKDGTLKQVVSTTAGDEIEARIKADFLAEEYQAGGVEVRAPLPWSLHQAFPEPWKAWE